MSGKRLLIVDDEIPPEVTSGLPANSPRGYMSYYLEELRDAGFELTVARGPDEALELIIHDKQCFELAIIDVMMPPGKAFAEKDTSRGVRTGILLVEAIRHRNPNLPIFILSNAASSSPDTTSRATSRATYRDLGERGVVQRVLAKLDVTPSDLVGQVRRFFKGV